MFIGINLGNVQEPKPVAPGRYPLTIATAEYREAKPDIQLSIGIDDQTSAPNIRHWVSLPKQDDDPSKAEFKSLMLKRFLTQFGIPFNETEGFNVEDFAGAHCASAQLTLTSPEDSKDGKTVYNNLALDRLPNEGTAPGAATPKS